MPNSSRLNDSVVRNFTQIKIWLIIPFLLILTFGLLYFMLFVNQGNYIIAYAEMQKEVFIYLNGKLSSLPTFQYNITQLGDALIVFPLLTIFIIYAPKFWEGLLISGILSLIVSAVFKRLIAMPRPAAMFDRESFVIIGETLTGHSSLPSGHSIATFIVISTLLFAFMPTKTSAKAYWTLGIISIGFIIAFSRVGVGAHYPIDVIVGAIIGFIIAVVGIKLSAKVKWFYWVGNLKYYPLYFIGFPIWMFFIGKKIVEVHLIVFYISIISLLITLYFLSVIYVKKKH